MKIDQPFYLWRNEQQAGPYTYYQLRAMWASGAVTGATLYWQEKMPEWVALSEISAALDLQAAAAPSKVAASSGSNGVAVRLAIYIILGICGAAYFLAHPLRSTSTASAPGHSHHYQVMVRGTSGVRFSGSVGVGGQSSTVSDTVPAQFDLTGTGCVAVLQKKGSDGVLTVDIVRDYEGVASQSSMAPYGVVQASAY